ncbi:hypothetical protein TGME49_295960 [Toxoplasma gondii ME49]|nr:hypothetical protein TGME49_295960 [Toxoplasma gondii ME49]EPR57755.1 hypothetical protein TGGT1_295960 [Toxoplasma gondii GT1]EPT32512.1 hypothetical protein TGME49_295960 [Toxoplasma gondii ME49]ESS29149.1 KRUF family protein [Toxoplasma gondii VEG]|eukprot:XP_018638544.1 hypothetical protein TGME49_295960 [Toxoplasma gondii ME49]
MIRENDRSPAASTQLHWKQQDRGNYHRFFSRRQAQVQELESQALILEQELHSLLSSSSGPETEPPPDFESATVQSHPPTMGKRKAKQKHLFQDTGAYPGESGSRGAPRTWPRSLWLTHVGEFPLVKAAGLAPARGPETLTRQLAQRQRDRRSEQVTASSSTTVKRAPQASGEQVPARREPVRSSTLHRSPAPSETKGTSGGIEAPPSKKARLLPYLSAQSAASLPSPPTLVSPLGPQSSTSTEGRGPPQDPTLSQGSASPQEVSRLTAPPPLAHPATSAAMRELTRYLSLPLKKRPIREAPSALHTSPTNPPGSEEGIVTIGPPVASGTEPSIHHRLPPTTAPSDPASASATAPSEHLRIHPRPSDP